MELTLCPCCSGCMYESCCALYHRNLALPSPEALMRARYCAYALGNVEYILKTTHPNHSDNSVPLFERRQQISAFCQKTQFLGLEILTSKTEEQIALVTFHATLMQNGKDISFTETSTFAFDGSQWLYLSGVVHV